MIAADRSSGDTGVKLSASCALGLAPRLRDAMHLSSSRSHSRHGSRGLGVYCWPFLRARISALRSGEMDVVNHGPPDTPEPGSIADPGSIASEARGAARGMDARDAMAKRRVSTRGTWSAEVEGVIADSMSTNTHRWRAIGGNRGCVAAEVCDRARATPPMMGCASRMNTWHLASCYEYEGFEYEGFVTPNPTQLGM